MLAQNFVTPGDAAMEIVRHVEKRRVAIAHVGVERKDFRRKRPDLNSVMKLAQHANGVACPDRPMAKKAALASCHRLTVPQDGKRRDEIEHNVIVVPV